MEAWLLAHEGMVRGAAFLALLLGLGLAESLAPRRAPVASRSFRWLHNLSLIAIDTVVLRLVFPLLLVEFAVLVQERGWGLLNLVALPGWVRVAAALPLLDLAIYAQHRAFHAVPLLWRLHMVHHADPDIDVTTGVRFHPVEMILSLAIKMAVVAALGAPPLAVVLFELLLNATSMFNHANIALPPAADRILRWIVVTPDMHRVHHSVQPHETNSNFGFNHPWWDRLFASYRDQPQAGHQGMTIGLTQFLERKRQSLAWMLALPVTGATGAYPSTRPKDGRR
ncbi:MAG: sterol desaturase family protein [Alphaproteobacteria bacterium]|nr:sterol desaturase family protein [Alphaproteobacteria bacterium]